MKLSPSFLAEAARWIGINTVTDRSNGALISRAEKALQVAGFSVRRQKVVERGVPFFNLLARRGPSGRPLLLNTHTDTVPPGPHERWTATEGDPFRLTQRGGFLHGLGAADVKLNLLCQIEALGRMRNLSFRRPVAVAATYGEERGLQGARRLIAGWRGPKPALVLDGEPTEMAVIHRHRGYLVFEWSLPRGPLLRGKGRVPLFELSIEGKSAHSSTPHLGVNALQKGLFFLTRLKAAGLNPHVAAARGGTAHNQVPAEASFSIVLPAWPGGLPPPRRRETLSLSRPVPLLPWELLTRLERVGRSLPRTHSMNWATLEGESGAWKVRFDLRFPPEDDPRRLVRLVSGALSGAGTLKVLLQDPPLDAPAGGPAVRLVRKALRGAGLPDRLNEKLTCTEAGLFDDWGSPAVVLGPGRSTGNIHRPNERIALSQLEKAVRFYESLLTLWTRS